MFERKSMEQMVTKMIKWARGSSTKFTDFRVGSKNRTLFEAVAVVLEEQSDRVYRTIRKLIEDGIYSIIGFDKIPATFASGTVTFSRTETADKDYLIPSGTLVMTQATSYRAPIRYRTTTSATLKMGTTSVDTDIVCEESGELGNTGANTIVDMISPPSGVDAVTNNSALTNGKEEESKSEQKRRFQAFIEANARGVLASIEYGSKTVQLTDSEGIITERVAQAVASEDLPDRRGEVDLHIWNGAGDASQALKDEVDKVLTGYRDEDDNPVYGYKSGGIMVNIYTAETKDLQLEMDVTPEEWSSESEVEPLLEAEVTSYLGELTMGSTFIQTELEARLKYIEGVYDVKLRLSTDGGTTFGTDNVTTLPYEVITMTSPISYTFL